MDNKKEVILKDGYLDCDVDISEQEWFEILKDKNTTKYSYKGMLIRFLEQPDYKATCKGIGEQYKIDVQSVNATIVAFCRAVHDKINRFDIEDKDQNKYWPFAMKGKNVGSLFEWTLRPELVAALKRVHFSWIPFYEEFAQKLLTYKDNRKELLDIVYSLDQEFIQNRLYDNQNNRFTDIDPYSVIANFNSNWSEDNRNIIIRHFKEKMNIAASLPEDYDGIPVINPKNQCFFKEESASEQIPILWDLFEAEMNDNESSLCENFNKIQTYRGIKWDITMAMYWLKPYGYMPLDLNSRNYLRTAEIDVFGDKSISGENYLKLIKKINEKLKNQNIPTISYHAWLKNLTNNEVKEVDDVNDNNDEPNQADLEKNKDVVHDEYVEKLIKYLNTNHNLILTGAPGTGKTHLAHDIAEAMGAKEGSEQYAFVQFHPSYDYTDFVEGLRPTKPDANGNIGFERRDGVFKEFCKKAILANEIQKFKESISGTPIQINSINNSNTKITVELNSKNNISVPDKSGWCISDEKMLKYLMFNECHDNETYTKSIGEYITDNLSDILAQENKNFVFIIDEINRGEISKIFGELFFSIDPDYRGAKGTVMTQYQNLVDDGDVFKRGFFVPENVYIIGTMNDIDRSVESMDFAIRRRFAWQEVDVTDRVDKMGVNDEAKERMRHLNEKISEIEGLGKSYQIGGSYFKGEVDINDLWNFHLEGLLREYLRGVPDIEGKMKDLKAAYNGNDASKKEDDAKENEDVTNDAQVENNNQ